MSAQYAAAADALERAESIVGPPSADTAALVGIGRALLAMGEELEALVELLRERLPVPERAESRGMVDPGAVPNALDVDEPAAAGEPVPDLIGALAASVERARGASS